MGHKTQSNLKKWAALFLTIICYYIIHEGAHLIYAVACGVFEKIRVVGWIGIQIVIQSDELSGVSLAWFSGISSLVTIVLGYLLFIFTPRILTIRNKSLLILLYYVTACFMILDPLYLSILSLFIGGGGDLNGITTGLNVSDIPFRIGFGIIAFLNIGLFITKIAPQYSKRFRA